MKSHRKIVFALVITQLILSAVSIHADASSVSDYLGVYLLSSFGTLLLLPSVLRDKKITDGPSMSIWAFYFSTIGSIVLLCLISSMAIFQGSLNEAGLIYASFIGIYVVLVPTGVVCGFVYHVIKNVKA